MNSSAFDDFTLARAANAEVQIDQRPSRRMLPAPDSSTRRNGKKKRARHHPLIAGGYPNNLASPRIEALEQLLAQDPNNTFVRYGLAMEFVNAGELERAVAEFETVREKDPSYGARTTTAARRSKNWAAGRRTQMLPAGRRNRRATRTPGASSKPRWIY
jgi:hypothetical protein